MKTVNCIYKEEVLRPDGTKAYVCTLMTPDEGASVLDEGVLLTSDVYGLNAGDIISDGSVLLTPEKKYIAWADNTFAEAGSAYSAASSGYPYYYRTVVSYYVADALYHEQFVDPVDNDRVKAINAPLTVPDGKIFSAWQIGATLYNPGDTLPAVITDTTVNALLANDPSRGS